MSLNYNVSDNLIRELLKNQKRDRFWRNLRFFIVLLIVGFGAFFALRGMHAERNKPDQPYVAFIRLSGIITAESDFSAERVLPQLEEAFADKHAKGVVIDIDSGGGSPVQASIIESKIIELKKRFHKKVIVVGEDVLASGAYLVAMGADEVYVNQDTITGSIGVIMEGFGFTDAIKKLGVTRRVFTAGDHKDRLDPFEPIKPEDREKISAILDEAHDHFIKIVMDSRGNRLKGDPKELFSGDFWLGSRALELGVVDGLGNTSDLIPRVFNVHHYVDYSEKPSILQDFVHGFATQLNLTLNYNHDSLVSKL